MEAAGEPFFHCDTVVLDPQHPNRLLGISPSAEEITTLLARVDIRAELGGDGLMHCRIPSYRNDIGIAEDLIEEVARIHGYDQIPSTLPVGALEAVAEPADVVLENAARDSLRRAGLNKINEGMTTVEEIVRVTAAD